ncbi:hypothetical protein SAMN03080599_02732 [Acidaminobacter hydrogenoformans DSM 2784]|uniref:Uncharacterized protein n=1 Tax=Acidaminobacter hydrogenoformans DSM 2784 TaxID=1120920 RepID=A0A1G5S577_9FIRM|nr:hypothetical protein SAMN03080599_02732 [Acidaminobacter hydrogenoformans DSM 2784]
MGQGCVVRDRDVLCGTGTCGAGQGHVVRDRDIWCGTGTDQKPRFVIIKSLTNDKRSIDRAHPFLVN